MIVLPDISAGAIVADPPLAFATWSRKGEGRSPQHHYTCLSFEQLAAIPGRVLQLKIAFCSFGSRCARCSWSNR
jgi:hypothetical protein